MNMQKILANAVVLAGFIVVPFIPFIVLSQSAFFPFIVGKNFAFRAVVEIMLAAYLVLAIIDPEYRPRKTYLLWAFVALLGIITLSAVLGANPTKSFWSNFERMEGVVTYFHLFAYFVVASTVITVRDMWRPYLNLHLGAGVIMAIVALVQLKGAAVGFRVDGTLGNSSYLGIYAFFNIFLAVFFMVRESFTTAGEQARIAIYGAIALLQMVVLYYTGTRGAILGLMAGAGLATILIAVFETKRKTLRMGAIGVLVALVLLVGGFMSVRDSALVKTTPLLARFSEISVSNLSSNARVMVWGMAYQGFKEHPYLGWGMENFNYVFNKYYDPKMYGQEQWFDRAHNVFFDWLIAAGVPGLLSYVALFACAIYCIWRRADSLSIIEKSILTGMLSGYFFQNLFVFDNLTSLIFFGTFLAYIESFSHKESKIIANSVSDDVRTVAGWGGVILAIILVYTVNYDGYMQNMTLVRAISQQFPEGAVKNLDLFKETLAYHSFGTAEAREQFAQISMNAFDKTQGVSELQKTFIITAANELMKQAAEVPGDARYQLFAGSFLVQAGQTDKALEYLLEAHRLSPNKQSILFELGNAYYLKKDMVKTEEMFRKAYELAPGYDNARKFYAEILKRDGKIAESKKILGEKK